MLEVDVNDIRDKIIPAGGGKIEAPHRFVGAFHSKTRDPTLFLKQNKKEKKETLGDLNLDVRCVGKKSS
jgi:hypothetical protein